MCSAEITASTITYENIASSTQAWPTNGPLSALGSGTSFSCRRLHPNESILCFLFILSPEKRKDVRPSKLEATDLLCGRSQHAFHRGIRHPDPDRVTEAVHGLPRVGTMQAVRPSSRQALQHPSRALGAASRGWQPISVLDVVALVLS